MVLTTIALYLFDLDPILKPFLDFSHICIKFISFLLDGQVNPLYFNTIELISLRFDLYDGNC